MPPTSQTDLSTKKWKYIATDYSATGSLVAITWDNNNNESVIGIDNMIVGSLGFIESGGSAASYEVWKDGYKIAEGSISANGTAKELILHVGEELEVRISGPGATVTTKFFGK